MNTPPLRYRAFLSYSHRDEPQARALHRRLERFRVPRALKRVREGELPARLHPVFRDRDELASSAQLSQSIEAALDESEALVVVCSPASSASIWVNLEIAYFRRTHPDRPVLAFVVAGDPGLDPRIHPDQAAFPPMLALAHIDQPDGALGEPLAADARPEGDGFSHAFLKLAAGLLEVRYDELRRRDQKRRQRFWIAAVSSALALAAAFALLAWQATRARNAARVAQARAELELASERQTREFLISVFELADANEARGERVTVREVLDRAVARIDRTEFSRPAIRGRFLATLGQAYSSLGLNRRGSELLQQSIAALPHDDGDPDTARQRIANRIALAGNLLDMGEYEAALAQLDALAQDGTVLDPLQRAKAANVRGSVLTYLERDVEASAAFDSAAESLEGAAASREVEEARATTRLGQADLALFAGDAASAQARYAEAAKRLSQALGEDHPTTLAALISLGSAAYRGGDRDTARSTWRHALHLAEKVFDHDSPQMGTLSNNLGLLLLEDGDLDAAEPLLRDALASDRKHRSTQFDDLAYPLYNLGYLLLARGQDEEARKLLDEGLELARSSGHRMLGAILSALADLHCSGKEARDGLAYAQRAIESTRQSDPWRAAQARLTLAYCQVRNGESPEAATLASDLELLREHWPSASPFVARAAAQLRAVHAAR